MRSDFWTSVEPNTKEFQRRARMADGLFGAFMRQKVLPVVQKNPSRAEAVSAAATDLLSLTTDKVIAGYKKDNLEVPVTIRVIVSPMVSWIWVGAIIAIIGALFAAWPSGLLKRSRGRKKTA